MTFLEAAVFVLEREGGPLHYREITQRAIKLDLLSHIGKTPEQAMQTRLAMAARRTDDADVIRTGPGIYASTGRLREHSVAEATSQGLPKEIPTEESPDAQPRNSRKSQKRGKKVTTEESKAAEAQPENPRRSQRRGRRGSAEESKAADAQPENPRRSQRRGRRGSTEESKAADAQKETPRKSQRRGSGGSAEESKAADAQPENPRRSQRRGSGGSTEESSTADAQKENPQSSQKRGSGGSTEESKAADAQEETPQSSQKRGKEVPADDSPEGDRKRSEEPSATARRPLKRGRTRKSDTRQIDDVPEDTASATGDDRALAKSARSKKRRKRRKGSTGTGDLLTRIEKLIESRGHPVRISDIAAAAKSKRYVAGDLKGAESMLVSVLEAENAMRISRNQPPVFTIDSRKVGLFEDKGDNDQRAIERRILADVERLRQHRIRHVESTLGSLGVSSLAVIVKACITEQSRAHGRLVSIDEREARLALPHGPQDRGYDSVVVLKCAPESMSTIVKRAIELRRSLRELNATSGIIVTSCLVDDKSREAAGTPGEPVVEIWDAHDLTLRMEKLGIGFRKADLSLNNIDRDFFDRLSPSEEGK